MKEQVAEFIVNHCLTKQGLEEIINNNHKKEGVVFIPLPNGLANIFKEYDNNYVIDVPWFSNGPVAVGLYFDVKGDVKAERVKVSPKYEEVSKEDDETISFKIGDQIKHYKIIEPPIFENVSINKIKQHNFDVQLSGGIPHVRAYCRTADNVFTEEVHVCVPAKYDTNYVSNNLKDINALPPYIADFEYFIITGSTEFMTGTHYITTAFLSCCSKAKVDFPGITDFKNKIIQATDNQLDSLSIKSDRGVFSLYRNLRTLLDHDLTPPRLREVAEHIIDGIVDGKDFANDILRSMINRGFLEPDEKIKQGILRAFDNRINAFIKDKSDVNRSKFLEVFDTIVELNYSPNSLKTGIEYLVDNIVSGDEWALNIGMSLINKTLKVGDYKQIFSCIESIVDSGIDLSKYYDLLKFVRNVEQSISVSPEVVDNLKSSVFRESKFNQYLLEYMDNDKWDVSDFVFFNNNYETHVTKILEEYHTRNSSVWRDPENNFFSKYYKFLELTNSLGLSYVDPSSIINAVLHDEEEIFRFVHDLDSNELFKNEVMINYTKERDSDSRLLNILRLIDKSNLDIKAVQQDFDIISKAAFKGNEWAGKFAHLVEGVSSDLGTLASLLFDDISYLREDYILNKILNHDNPHDGLSKIISYNGNNFEKYESVVNNLLNIMKERKSTNLLQQHSNHSKQFIGIMGKKLNHSLDFHSFSDYEGLVKKFTDDFGFPLFNKLLEWKEAEISYCKSDIKKLCYSSIVVGSTLPFIIYNAFNLFSAVFISEISSDSMISSFDSLLYLSLSGLIAIIPATIIDDHKYDYLSSIRTKSKVGKQLKHLKKAKENILCSYHGGSVLTNSVSDDSANALNNVHIKDSVIDCLPQNFKFTDSDRL